MSWLPEFQIGVWNAWIPMLYWPLHPLIIKAIDQAVGTGEIFKKMGEVAYDKREKRNYTIFMAVNILLIVYSIFLPLKLGTAWFYAGLAIYILGLVIFFSSTVSIATAPKGQLFKGIYRYSRHPGYVSLFLLNVGVGIASASWIFLLFSVVIIALLTSQVAAEERGCLEIFGDEYRQYMDRTPRWMGIPRSK